ncbi:MAG: bacteriohemerythrin [Chloroflexi bacterium]|nr:bacteriohemerythrin [Chloroflexota bacterium]MCA2000240.1 bacteriohemerythrin [Chloroflexota bacterium]
MEEIKWANKFSVGVRELDEQHRQIILMLNRLLSEPEARNVNSEVVSEILTAMFRYSLEHFKTEENLLRTHKYPQLEEHRREHNEYRRKILDFSAATGAGVKSVPQNLLDYLSRWWTRHILEEDMKYKSFFAEKGVR